MRLTEKEIVEGTYIVCSNTGKLDTYYTQGEIYKILEVLDEKDVETETAKVRVSDDTGKSHDWCIGSLTGSDSRYTNWPIKFSAKLVDQEVCKASEAA